MDAILVVGGDSNTGKHLRKITQTEKYRYIFTSRNKKISRPNIIYYDILDINSLNQIDLSAIKKVLILAGITNISACEKNPSATSLVNVNGIKSLIERLSGDQTQIYYVSSSCVFPEKSIGNHEFSSCMPCNEYGRQKYLLEKYLQSKDNATILRVTKVISPNNLLLRTWWEQLNQGATIQAAYDLHVAPISIDSFCKSLINLIEGKRPKSKIIHFSPDKQISYYQLAKLVCKYINSNSTNQVSAVSAKVLKPNPIYIPQDATLRCLLPSSYIYNSDKEIIKIFDSM